MATPSSTSSSSVLQQINEDDSDFAENSLTEILSAPDLPSFSSGLVLLPVSPISEKDDPTPSLDKENIDSSMITPTATLQKLVTRSSSITPMTQSTSASASSKPSYFLSPSISRQLWNDTESPPVTPAETSPSSEKLGRGLRPKNPPTKLADYVVKLNTLIHEPHPLATPYPLDNYLSSSQFSDDYQTYIFAITLAHEPQHYKEAVLDENWRFAIQDGIVSLEDRGTWTIENLPQGKKAMGCKWVF
ncbi:hypothetical protein V5N11_025132 [Cardamine amara subsp. amara]|uniref:Uncharacterized protein n=1 Tax=Cardamine amara subsp. amara TaxID=228776 RepID=A0ABD0ZX60_CARAN